jgi:hypothetical protein
MATDRLKNSALPRALSDVVTDVADLFQKELQLARAELGAKLSIKLRAGVWMSTGAGFALVAVVLLVQALVVWLTTLGIALHLSCLIIAVVMAAAASLAFYQGYSDSQEELTPRRTIYQIKEDITTTKEQLK